MNRFETIYLADRKVLVDKEAIIKGDDYRCYKKTITGNVISNEPISEKELNLVNIATNVFKVIAANPQLGDLPLLPEMGDEVVKLAAKEYPVTPFYDGDEFPYYDTNYDLRTGYAKGFKAAKELYPFSKDDMIEFLKWVVEKQWENDALLNLIRHQDFISIFELYLNQKPKPQFIPEMEVKKCCMPDNNCEGSDLKCSYYNPEPQPKIDKQTNTLIGRWV